jgi:hypothetical protein
MTQRRGPLLFDDASKRVLRPVRQDQVDDGSVARLVEMLKVMRSFDVPVVEHSRVASDDPPGQFLSTTMVDRPVSLTTAIVDRLPGADEAATQMVSSLGRYYDAVLRAGSGILPRDFHSTQFEFTPSDQRGWILDIDPHVEGYIRGEPGATVNACGQVQAILEVLMLVEQMTARPRPEERALLAGMYGRLESRDASADRLRRAVQEDAAPVLVLLEADTFRELLFDEPYVPRLAPAARIQAYQAMCDAFEMNASRSAGGQSLSPRADCSPSPLWPLC